MNKVHITFKRQIATLAGLSLNRLIITIFGVVFWAVASLGPATASDPVPIFVLHSYSQEYPWTKGQYEGFLETLTGDERTFDLKVEYLDTKRTGYTPAYAAQMANSLRAKYRGYHPAAIYITDDNALGFVLTHLGEVFPNTPVFFSGVNNYSVKGELDHGRITGVFEKKEIAPNLELLRTIAPDSRDIVIVGDATETYKAIEREIHEELALQEDSNPIFISSNQIDDLLKSLRDQKSPFVFLTTLGALKDREGRTLTLNETIEAIVKAGKFLVFSMEDSYLFPGVLGGYVTSGPSQGRTAADLMLRHLGGDPVSSLPPVELSPNEYVFDALELSRSGLELPSDIASQAVFLNIQPGFYAANRTLILGGLYVFAIISIVMLIITVIIYSTKNRQLQSSSRQLEQQKSSLDFAQRQLHEGIESMSEGFALFDKEDRLVLFNSVYKEMYSSHADAIQVGNTLEEILRLGLERRAFSDAIDNEETWLAERLAEHLEPGSIPVEQRLSNGKWLLISEHKTRDGGIVGARTDITALKEAERVATEASKTKSAFLASMSHEIRTPITGAMGFVEMLLDEELSEKSRESVHGIKDTMDILMNLLNDILDLSKLESVKMEIENIDFDLPSLIGESTALYEHRMTGGRIVLNTALADDFPETANSDPSRIRQVLLNLIGNAVKFTEQGDVTIEGSLFLSDDGEPFIRIAVQDTGIGMKPEVFGNLFKDFTQADSSISRRYGGAGLGLSICKHLVELMGGEIGVTSEYHKGSTFWFTVPYVASTSDVEIHSKRKMSKTVRYLARRPLHVLVVDDNSFNQRIINATVQKFGHTSEVANDGMKAIEEHKSGAYDLILMDVRMPGLSGPEATQLIRKMEGEKSKIPIIALTADVMRGQRKQYLEAGMDAVVAKPIDRKNLALMINDVMHEEIHALVEA